MPVDPNAPVRISAFNWVPPFAQGQVRDLRPRWALEEAGIAYAVRKLDARAERPADYYEEQPFGQVPVDVPRCELVTEAVACDAVRCSEHQVVVRAVDHAGRARGRGCCA